MSTTLSITFENDFANTMEGFYVPWKAAKAEKPEIVVFNEELCKQLGLDETALNSDEGAQFFSGNVVVEGSKPIAQVYAGHQFGGFSPQLGDGRALLLGEVIDVDGARKDVQLKGSGRTPFSRNGDGKAAIAPVLREYLMGEAMHALGIPTTRALAAVTTGEKIIREGFQRGGVLTRVASSHLRVGTFQYFAARQDHEKLKQLADYAIQRHYPELANEDEKYLLFLKEVQERQASLVAKWVSVGFVHGVMNTDNMTISGETIDYGPCAFMDAYDPKTVFSSIDDHGRYAYGNQPVIAQWNLARFAETLIPLINPKDSDAAIKSATDILNGFPEIYQLAWLNEMRKKLGLTERNEGDIEMVNHLHTIIEGKAIDYTLLFKNMAGFARGEETALLEMFEDKAEIEKWLEGWLGQIHASNRAVEQTANAMDCVNPVYISRNHLVEDALQEASDNENYKPFNILLDLVKSPFEEKHGFEDYKKPAPKGSAPYVTYCGT